MDKGGNKEYKDIPLFSDKGLGRKGKERVKPAKTVAWALCPMHLTDTVGIALTDSSRRTGLVRVGEHLVWKIHYIRLGRSSIPCRSGGSSLCVVEPVDGKMKIFLPHDRTSKDTGIRRGVCPHERPTYETG